MDRYARENARIIEVLHYAALAVKKVEACKSSEEILALAKAEGVTLNDEQLEAVSGGGCVEPSKPKCPSCGAKEDQELRRTDALGRAEYKCHKCGNYYWK